MLSFTWDQEKALINRKKHGITFDEACTVFFDSNAILFDDPAHSYGEERFLIIGITANENLCIVSHCYRDNDNCIRIISARKAVRSERMTYIRHLGGVII